MGELEFHSPMVPFRLPVPSGLGVGRKIKIKGKSEYQREPRFCINLGVGPAFHENIALHISPRHHENCIVITSLNMGRWGIEQRLHNPIHSREHFEFKIKVEPGFYNIELDDHHFASIPHTFPPHMVNHLEIEGGVKIDHIKIEGHSEGGVMMMEPGYATTTVYQQGPPMVVTPMMPPVIIEEHRPPVVIAPMRPAVVIEPRHPTVVIEPRRHHNVVVVDHHRRHW